VTNQNVIQEEIKKKIIRSVFATVSFKKLVSPVFYLKTSHINGEIWIVFKSRILMRMYGRKEEVTGGWRK
jgi:hypothetical protein